MNSLKWGKKRPSKNLKPYQLLLRLAHRNFKKGGQWEYYSDVKEYLNKNVWVALNSSFTLHKYVGSEKPIADSMTEEASNQYKVKGFEVSMCPVQASESAVVG